jgi:nitroreductase
LRFDEVLRRRRMTRSFLPTPVPDDVLDRVLAAGRRAPSAGNTQGTDLVVLTGADTARYWEVTLPAERQASFAFPGLLAAPVLVIPVASPGAYLRRYSEEDKAATGLGGRDAWPVPYWFVDAGFAAMLVQLAAVDEGLGVLFFGIFEHTDAVRGALGIPDDRDPIGTIAMGYADPSTERPGRSASRARREPHDVVHRGGW